MRNSWKMCAVWQSVPGYSVYTKDQTLARRWALALAFHMAVTLTQPGAEPTTRSSECGWGNWSPHGECKRGRLCMYTCVCTACTQMVQFLRGRKTGSGGARESFFAVPSGIIHDFTDQNYLFQHSLDVSNKPVICRSGMSQLPAPSCWVPVWTAQPSCPHLLEWHL